MPISTKQKPGRGIPRKSGNTVRKARYARYLAKSSCFHCKLVFRSPKYKCAHVASGHTLMAGNNPRRSSASAGERGDAH